MKEEFKDKLSSLGLGKTATISFKLNHEEVTAEVLDVEVKDTKDE